MKQPLMIIPPAQAEALFDAALQSDEPGKRQRGPVVATLGEDWDDQGSSDGLDDGPFTEPTKLAAGPKFPLRTIRRSVVR